MRPIPLPANSRPHTSPSICPLGAAASLPARWQEYEASRRERERDRQRGPLEIIELEVLAAVRDGDDDFTLFRRVNGRLCRAGYGSDEFEDEIADCTQWAHELANTAAQVDAQGGGGREELDIAGDYWDAVGRAEASRSPAPKFYSPVLIDVVPMRTSRARESGGSAPGRRQGSRRSTTSGTDPGDDSDPHLVSPLLSPALRPALVPAVRGWC
jgi:hypothetical protein